MSVARDFLATLYKMFAADLVMTLLALATVALCAVLGATIGDAALPWVLVCGVAGALVIAVVRGSKT